VTTRDGITKTVNILFLKYKDGDDWTENYPLCSTDFGNQAPLILKTDEALKLSNEFYFFSKMNKNLEGSLDLEDFRNNLVLTFDERNPIGTIYYNLDKDDFDEYFYYFFNCTKLYFRIPGEHILDDIKYDMELQFNCSGKIPGDKSGNIKYVFVATPVKAVDDADNQSQFFNNFEVLLKDDVKTENLPYKISVESFDEILNPFNMFNKIFFYSGSVNYPECMINSNWIFIDNPVTIRKNLLQKFYSLLDKDQIDDGNNRKAVPKTQDYYILENSFNVMNK